MKTVDMIKECEENNSGLKIKLKRELHGFTMGDLLDDEKLDQENEFCLFYVTFNELHEFVCANNLFKDIYGNWIPLKHRHMEVAKLLHDKLIIIPITDEYGRLLSEIGYKSSHYDYVSGCYEEYDFKHNSFYDKEEE